MKSIAQLRKEARNLNAVIRIGKSGITENLIVEIKKQLKLRRTLKIKLLKSFIDVIDDKRELVEDIAIKTDAVLVEIKGNTFVLHKN